MRVDIMVDIETLGIKTDNTIFQIAAKAFNIKTGDVFAEFNEIADIEQSKISVDGGTLKWWLDINKELLSDLLHRGDLSPKELLSEFFLWLHRVKEEHEADIYLWGYGILFDNAMIKIQLENMGLSYPIYYQNDRDLRTLVELTQHKTGLKLSELKDRFIIHRVEHDAMNDVDMQIELACGCYELLMG